MERSFMMCDCASAASLRLWSKSPEMPLRVYLDDVRPESIFLFKAPFQDNILQ